MPKGYIIGHGTVHDAEAYQLYASGNPEHFAKFGGKFIVRGGQTENPEADFHVRHVIVEFPSYEAAKAAYFDPEYQKKIPIRHANSDGVVILVEGTA